VNLLKHKYINLAAASIITLMIASVDQFSKHLALTTLHYLRPVKFIPFINWKLSFNEGAAFGFLASYGGLQRWFFIIVTLIICSFIAKKIYQYKNDANKKLEIFALASILGGAIGNFIDRVRLGYVVDFIDCYLKSYHWYTFNVADMAILCGVAIYVLVAN
jgi:signal peptidase II